MQNQHEAKKQKCIYIKQVQKKALPNCLPLVYNNKKAKIDNDVNTTMITKVVKSEYKSIYGNIEEKLIKLIQKYSIAPENR